MNAPKIPSNVRLTVEARSALDMFLEEMRKFDPDRDWVATFIWVSEADQKGNPIGKASLGITAEIRSRLAPDHIMIIDGIEIAFALPIEKISEISSTRIHYNGKRFIPDRQ